MILSRNFDTNLNEWRYIMKSIVKWMHNDQFRIDNNRDFIISVSEPCEFTDSGEPNSWELILMGFSGCIASKFVKTAVRNRIYFTDVRVELNLKTQALKPQITIDAVLKINTTADIELMDSYFEEAIRNSPLGLFLSQASVPVRHTVKYLNHVKAQVE
jgi:uncharacterized OsmC-like protein